MDEETTTSTQVDDSTASDNTEQAEETTEQAVEDESTETSASELTDEEKEWADKKGLKLDDPVALARMIREGDKKVTEATQKASELGKSVQTASTEIGLDDVAQLRNEVAVMNFYQNHPEARTLDEEMSKTLEEKPYFANDLEGLLYYTKGREADKAALAARQAGRKDALEASAQAERASAPTASASVRTTPAGEATDEEVRAMSIAEYEQAKADGRISF